MENENNDQQSNYESNFLSQKGDNISNSENFQISEDTPSLIKRKKSFFIILLILFLISSAVFFGWKTYLKHDISDAKLTEKINIDDVPKERWSEKDFVIKVMKKNGWALEYASPELQADKEVVLAAVKQNGYALEYASPELQDDKEVVLQAVKENKYAFHYASIRLRANKEFVLEMVRQNINVIKEALPDPRSDKEVMLEAVKKWGSVLEYTYDLESDKEVVLEAVKNDGAAFQYASPELQMDKDVIMNAKYIYDFKNISPKLRADKEVVLKAVKEVGLDLQYASPELQDDKEVALAAVKQNGYAFQYVSPNLQADKEVESARNLPKANVLYIAAGVFYWITLVAVPISFISLIVIAIMVFAFHNIKAKIFIYDFSIAIIFLIVAYIIISAEMAVMCDCFANTYGPIINLVSSAISIAWLCILNHSKKMEETTSKWNMIAYTGVVFSIFLIANIVIVFIGENFYVSPMSRMF